MSSALGPRLMLPALLALTAGVPACLVFDLGPAGESPPPPPEAADLDGDGAAYSIDCDDADPQRSPDFNEACQDDSDNDCDAAVDEDCGCTAEALLGIAWAEDAQGNAGEVFTVDAPPTLRATLTNPCNNTVTLIGADACFGRLDLGRGDVAAGPYPAACGDAVGRWDLEPGQGVSLAWDWPLVAAEAPDQLGVWRLTASWANGDTDEAFVRIGLCPPEGCTPTPTQPPTPTPTATPTSTPTQTEDDDDDDDSDEHTDPEPRTPKP